MTYESKLIKLLRLVNHGLDGLTLGHHIFILYPASDLRASHVKLHEAVHVTQYERYGSLGFVIRYIWFSLKYGYTNNPLEIEAREISGY